MKVKQVIQQIKTLPKDTALAQFANELRKRQMGCTADGKPITEDELVRDLTSDYKGMRAIYKSMGISLDELIVAGKEAIADNRAIMPEPKGFQTIYRVAEKFGRNISCPCGSGRKYKKCCGR